MTAAVAGDVGHCRYTIGDHGRCKGDVLIRCNAKLVFDTSTEPAAAVAARNRQGGAGKCVNLPRRVCNQFHITDRHAGIQQHRRTNHAAVAGTVQTFDEGRCGVQIINRRGVVDRRNAGAQRCRVGGPGVGGTDGGADVLNTRGQVVPGIVSGAQRQTARCTVIVAIRYKLDFVIGIGQIKHDGGAGGDVSCDAKPGATVQRVLPRALCRDRRVADDGQRTLAAGSVAAASDTTLRIGGVAIGKRTGNICRRARRCRGVFQSCGQRGGAAERRRIVNVSNGGADGSIYRAPGPGGAGAAVGNIRDVVLRRVARTGGQRHTGISQTHGQRAGRTKVVGCRDKAHLAGRAEYQRRGGAQVAHRDIDPVARLSRARYRGNLPDTLRGYGV